MKEQGRPARIARKETAKLKAILSRAEDAVNRG